MGHVSWWVDQCGCAMSYGMAFSLFHLVPRHKQTHRFPSLFGVWLTSMPWSRGLLLNFDFGLIPSLLTPLRLNLPRRWTQNDHHSIQTLIRGGCSRYPRLAHLASWTEGGETGPVASGVSGDWALMAIQYLANLEQYWTECFLPSAAICPFLNQIGAKLSPCLLPLTVSG